MGAVSVAPASAEAGASVQLSWTVQDTGSAPASGGWQDAVYLGTSPGATTTLLGLFSEPASSPVPAGGSYSDTEPVTIPAGTSAGSYYLTVVADSDGSLAVSSTANDSGSTSVTVTANPSKPTLRAVAEFPGAPEALAVGDGGTVVQWNGSWVAESSGTINNLYGVAFDSYSGAAIVVGAHGTVLDTADGGSSWSIETPVTTEDLYSISCTGDSPTCWAVGAAGTVLATTDGTHWVPQSSGTSEPLYGVACISTSRCWAVGANGTIIATTDGGTAWASQASKTTETLYSISCEPSGTTCWAVGAGGTVLTTTDGSTWSAEPSGTNADLYAVAVGSYCGGGFAFCLVAVGAGGTMLDYSGSSWGLAASGTSADLYGFTYVTYFANGGYLAVGADETELSGTAPQH